MFLYQAFGVGFGDRNFVVFGLVVASARGIMLCLLFGVGSVTDRLLHYGFGGEFHDRYLVVLRVRRRAPLQKIGCV